MVGTVGGVAFATPAAADVIVTPAEVARGDAGRMTFRIPNERAPAYTVKVEIHLPEAAPVAEVYPISVDDWAPRLTMRKLEKPVQPIHGVETTEVVSMVTWTRATDAPPDASRPADLTISLGPMPEADRLEFPVIQTYSDGTVVRWGGSAPGDAQPARPAPVVKLVPGAAKRHGDSARSAADGDAGGDSSGGTMSAIGVGVATALVTGALMVGGWAFFSPSRRRLPAIAAATRRPVSPAGPRRPRRMRRIRRIRRTP